MGKKLTKVARGIAFGDAQNVAIRNILTEISKKMFNPIDEKYMKETRAYFNNKCPYTGKDMDILEQTGQIASDHIVPQNREFCGLNVPGNLIEVDKTANSKKGRHTVEDFLLNNVTGFFDDVAPDVRKDRYEKIKKFQELHNYDPDKIQDAISKKLNEIYSQIRLTQVGYINQIEVLLNSKINTLQKNIFAPDNTRKIGDIVKHEFFDILMNGQVPKAELLNLQDPAYCKKTFGISQFPVLSKTKITSKGDRSYAKPIVIFGEEYYVCNDWHEKKSREQLIEYISNYFYQYERKFPK